jgi:hypothetical protein
MIGVSPHQSTVCADVAVVAAGVLADELGLGGGQGPEVRSRLVQGIGQVGGRAVEQ